MKNNEDYIDFEEVYLILWHGKKTIALFVFIFSIIGVAYALSQPNVYRSSAILVPSEESKSGGLAGLASQLGGLASLAGVNVSKGGSNSSVIALEMLKSKAFIGEFVEKYNLAVPLLAVSSWNLSTNKLIIDPEIYDNHTKTWIREVSPLRKVIPSNQELANYFISELLRIGQNQETGIVSLSITYYSPEISQKILIDLIGELNSKMKRDDILEAETSIKYLNLILEETPNVGLRNVFYQLIEQQEQTKMLANTRDDYIFKVIEPPLLPEVKYGPKRALIAIASAIIGLFIGFFIVLLRYFFKKS